MVNYFKYLTHLADDWELGCFKIALKWFRILDFLVLYFNASSSLGCQIIQTVSRWIVSLFFVF